MKYFRLRQALFGVVVLFLVFSHTATSAQIDTGRNKLLAYMLSKQLPAMHFSDKQIDNTLAAAAFDLYLKQLDFQKRFLLTGDVAELSQLSTVLDDNLKRGEVIAPRIGYGILSARIDQVEVIIRELFKEGFDPNRAELLETDPDKLAYCRDLGALRERWRKMLKSQVNSRFLTLKEDNPDSKSDETLWKEAREKVEKRNKNLINRIRQETLQDHYDRYFNAVARAFDPHTNYMPPANKEDFDIHMRGSLEGIGALLREEDGYIKVVRIIPGSASFREGRLSAEDIILSVAQGGDEPVEITDMRLRDAVRLIRGPKGSEVRLTVKKPDSSRDVISIIRDVVQIEETFVKSTLLTDKKGDKVGYVLVPSFYRDFEKTRNGSGARNSTDDTRQAILDLKKKGIRGLILDLRNNGGGSLMDAVDIAGLFVDYGPMVQVKNSYGTKKVLTDDDRDIVYSGPLLVLVNQFSASASEIVAAALQDYGRAVIVGGAHTHGKGTVQTIVDLSENIPLLHLRKYDDLGALKVTIQKFYRVNGGSTQYKGVEPDIVLPSLFANLESGEQYLDYSLPWDRVEAVEIRPVEESGVNFQELKSRSGKRVKEDQALLVIGEEAAKAAARREKTRTSLKITDMEEKRADAKQARKKIGAHYRKFRDEGGDDGTMEHMELNGTAPGDDKWVDEVNEDPYIDEAMRVIGDMAL
ncbi:MAG: carboxy terminal-processing peptidase [Thermodesulfobacteriota bacterium]